MTRGIASNRKEVRSGADTYSNPIMRVINAQSVTTTAAPDPHYFTHAPQPGMYNVIASLPQTLSFSGSNLAKAAASTTGVVKGGNR